jgi:pyridoxal/pyridoxine/pyridoxamine kinase
MLMEGTTSGYDLIACGYVMSTEFVQAVAEALETAKETIYIADWWLSPELVSSTFTCLRFQLTICSS